MPPNRVKSYGEWSDRGRPKVTERGRVGSGGGLGAIFESAMARRPLSTPTRGHN